MAVRYLEIYYIRYLSYCVMHLLVAFNYFLRSCNLYTVFNSFLVIEYSYGLFAMADSNPSAVPRSEWNLLHYFSRSRITAESENDSSMSMTGASGSVSDPAVSIASSKSTLCCTTDAGGATCENRTDEIRQHPGVDSPRRNVMLSLDYMYPWTEWHEKNTSDVDECVTSWIITRRRW